MGLAMLLACQPLALQQGCQNLPHPGAKGAPPAQQGPGSSPRTPGRCPRGSNKRGPRGARPGPAASFSRPDIYFGFFAPDARYHGDRAVTWRAEKSPSSKKMPGLQAHSTHTHTAHTHSTHTHTQHTQHKNTAPGRAARTAGLHAP